jgi:glycosyltransferase involved in cell wall biosynthesis
MPRRCPTIEELPPPPAGRTGWPWTVGSPAVVGEDWPTISIVTPSYNQAEFIEETIRSILLQGYPKLEYFVLDGGSSDASAEVIGKYAPWLDGWVSEKDRGQSHAINKGLERVTGDLFNWINSDDFLCAGALSEVARVARGAPGALVCGPVTKIHADGARFGVAPNENLSVEDMLIHWTRRILYAQPGVFVPVAAVREVGVLDEQFHFCFDWEWMLRLLERHPVRYVSMELAAYRYHDASKTVALADRFDEERQRITLQYAMRRGSVRQQRLVTRYYEMKEWMREIDELRRSRDRPLAIAGRIASAAASQPWRLARRFTWGAIHQALRRPSREG